MPSTLHYTPMLTIHCIEWGCNLRHCELNAKFFDLNTHKLDKLGVLLCQSSYDVLLLKTFVGDLFCK
jgi:hypothetical protein